MQLGDGRADAQQLLDVVKGPFSREHHVFDIKAIARESGTVVSAVMLGAIAGSGLFPFPREAYEHVVRGGDSSAPEKLNRMAAASLRGFASAFEAVDAPRTQAAFVSSVMAGEGNDAPPPVAALPADLARRFPPAVHDMLALGHARVLDYQDAAYASLYAERLGRVLDAERAADPAGARGFAVTREAAPLARAVDGLRRHRARGRAKRGPASRAQRVRREVRAGEEDIVKVYDHFKPGAAEFAALLPASLATAWAAIRFSAWPRCGCWLRCAGCAGAAAALRKSRPSSSAGWPPWKPARARPGRWATNSRCADGSSRATAAPTSAASTKPLHVIDELAGRSTLAASERATAIAAAREAALADEGGKALDAPAGRPWRSAAAGAGAADPLDEAAAAGQGLSGRSRIQEKETRPMTRPALPWRRCLLLLAAAAMLAPRTPTTRGAADQIARAISQPLQESLKQPVVIENRAGANGNLGGEAVARAPADGYTLLMSSGGMVSVNPPLYSRMSFDPAKDLVPVAAAARGAGVPGHGPPSLPPANVKEFISYVKANPGKLSYGSPGNGSSPHLCGRDVQDPGRAVRAACALSRRRARAAGPAGRPDRLRLRPRHRAHAGARGQAEAARRGQPEALAALSRPARNGRLPALRRADPRTPDRRGLSADGPAAQRRGLPAPRPPRAAAAGVRLHRGGAEDERCLRRNREALEALPLIPECLRDTSKVDIGTELFGRRWRAPFAIAPIGLAGLVGPPRRRPAGARGRGGGGRALHSFDGLEHTHRGGGAAPRPTPRCGSALRDGRTRHRRTHRAPRAPCGLRGARAHGDVPVSGLRERDLRHGFRVPMRLTPGPCSTWRGTPHGCCGWPAAACRSSRTCCRMKTTGRRSRRRPRPRCSRAPWTARSPGRGPGPAAQALGRGPLLVKGLLGAEDARRALRHGADGIVGAPTTAGGNSMPRRPPSPHCRPCSMRSAAHAGAGGRGMRRGSDIVKALALGANAALVGRAPVYGLACGGEGGALSVLQLLARKNQKHDDSAGGLARRRTRSQARRDACIAFADRTSRARDARIRADARESLHLPRARGCLDCGFARRDTQHNEGDHESHSPTPSVPLHALGLAAAAAALALAFPPTQAQDKPAGPHDIKKESGGTITAILFPSEQLGKAFDHYDMARDGIADFSYVTPGVPAGPLPGDGGCVTALPVRQRKGKGFGRHRRLVPQLRGQGDEGRQVLLRLRARPGHLPLAQEDHRARRHQGHEGAPGHQHRGPAHHLAGGHNVQASAPESRDMLERGVADAITFPWGSIGLFGIDKVVKYHMDVPLKSHALRVGDEQGQVRRDVRRAEEGDRRPLHQRVGAEGGGPGGPTSSSAAAPRWLRCRGTRFTSSRPSSWGMAQAAAPSEAQWADSVKKVGEDPKAVMDALKASLTKYKSAL
ncbi:FMN-dependent dehydrogenase domain-containing protein [Ditylenchus destructor]|uniref:FMN-dependent dehydrogenase domain-containing protein n=1 Tax=Ditylenchus destructor TaxID=166010 RepID=A0AAD4MH05_9BILA|nr:FMN-dependent dehydrogenase domain-containing protein [Ditylenchus destructor]